MLHIHNLQRLYPFLHKNLGFYHKTDLGDPIPTLILDFWMLGVVHVKYVHYHPSDDLHLDISLGMKGIQLGDASVQ